MHLEDQIAMQDNYLAPKIQGHTALCWRERQNISEAIQEREFGEALLEIGLPGNA